MKYRTIRDLSRTFPVVLLCEIAGVSKAGFYKWLKRDVPEREKENEYLISLMKREHEKRQGIYGYRRMTIFLNRTIKKAINKKRVLRLMKIAQIKSVIRRKKVHRKYKPEQIHENVLDRDFKTTKLNEKWVTDVTEMIYGNGQKAYLSAILDLHENMIIHYEVGKSNNNQLVFKTIQGAILKENPIGTMIHSDRGFQYTSKIFGKMIREAGMIQSMSRVGRCLDNACIEGFFGALKSEKYHLNRYETFTELKEDIDDYMYFYNHERFQENLNNLTPMEYRSKAA
ncbi:IS3 family transposase [Pseudalkalibacillus sp. A8]|uniref:IS3 family transposase n=1 Tax=Pseudalkalibacillus sp. A8 TaxID=3382641 RepID=UPI0038B5BC45